MNLLCKICDNYYGPNGLVDIEDLDNVVCYKRHDDIKDMINVDKLKHSGFLSNHMEIVEIVNTNIIRPLS